ncbi:MAG: hypothetical protein R3Y28_00675 [Candidatus Gastranaerophilales bacterium]
MKKLLITTIMLMTTATTSYASLKVTPTVLELNANNARGNYITTSFDVQGGEDETIRFKVYPSYFEISNQGKMLELSQESSEHSLIKNARFMPNEFTLSNGKPQKVRLTVANLKSLPEGESRMILFLEDVVAKEVLLPNQKKDVVTKLMVKTRVGIPVYVDKGRFVKCASFDDLMIKKKPDGMELNAKLVSKGNSKVRYTGKAQIIKDKQLIDEFTLNSSAIRNNGEFYLVQAIPLEKITEVGDYKLRAILNYKNEKSDNKQIIKEAEFSVNTIESTKI